MTIEKIKVVLRALPSYLAVASALLTLVATQLVPLLPPDLGLQVAAWCATAVAFIASVVATIKRLTPADPDTYGLLPPPPSD